MVRASAQAAAHPELISELVRFSFSDIGRMAHQELRLQGGAFCSFLVALADVSRVPNPVTNSRSRLRSNPRPIDRPDFVIGEGYSSPMTAGSSEQAQSSPYSPQDHGPLDFDEQSERIKHEAVSAHMAGEFISTVLDLLAGQTSPESRVEFCNAPTKFDLECPSLSCSCQDDGALVRRKFNAAISQWTSNDSFLCSLEAKSRYTKADAISGMGTVSERVLAQQVCEMLGSVMSIVEDGDYEDLTSNDRW
jgi:hypothetical protein